MSSASPLARCCDEATPSAGPRAAQPPYHGPVTSMVAHDAAAGVTGEGAGPPVRRAPARTYLVRTYGCQMNVHDSERLAGLLEAAG